MFTVLIKLGSQYIYLLEELVVLTEAKVYLSQLGYKQCKKSATKMEATSKVTLLQQDPLWPTSQNIRNKSKNKQMGPNET